MADPISRWSSLPTDVLEVIASKTITAATPTGLSEDYSNYFVFRKVCSSWRAAATKELFVTYCSRASKLPYLMLPEKEGSDEREFYNVFTRKICGRVSLPEVTGKRCIEARFGWLLTLANSGEVQLFNPVSRSCIQLPDFKKDHKYFNQLSPPFRAVRRAVLSANPSETSDFVLLVRVNYVNFEFWRNGDENWSLLKKPSKEPDSIQDVMYSERDRKFYAVCGSGLIYGWDPKKAGDRTVAETMCGVCPWHTGLRSGHVQGYLMESPLDGDGDLLLVTRNGQHSRSPNYTYGTTIFKVFRINVKKLVMEEVERLENEAIFVGHSDSICVPASKFDGLVKSNCIYFSDDSIDAYLVSFHLAQKEERENDEEDEKASSDEEEGKDSENNKEDEEEVLEEDGDDDDDNEEEVDEKASSDEKGGKDSENKEEDEEEVSEEDGDDDHDDEEEVDEKALSGEGGNEDENVEEDGEEDDSDEEVDDEFLWGGGSFDATKGGGKNMGIYNLEDGSIERFDECVERLSLVCPSLWITTPPSQLKASN